MSSPRTDPTPRADADGDGARRWWQFPLVWMVIGGPAAVVVAAFVTLAVAITHPDPEVGVDRPAASSAHGGSGAR